MSKIDEINKTVKEIAKDYGIPSKMIDEYIEGRTTLISTIPKPIMDTNKVKSLVESICCELGLNTAQDYDGIETDEDIIIYLNAINRKITLDKNNKLTKTSNNIMKLEHGQLAQDKITGFTGMVTGHSDYMTGCDQYLLQPPCKKKVFILLHNGLMKAV